MWGRVVEDQFSDLIFGEIGVDDVEAWSGAEWWPMRCGSLGIALIDGGDAGIAATDMDDYESADGGGDYGGDGLEDGSEVAARREGRDCGVEGKVEVGVEENCVVIGDAAEVVGAEA